MRRNSTPEERRLGQIVEPYMKVFRNPFRVGLDETAPQDVKNAYSKLQNLIEENDRACRDF
nr:MAG TPA_asm: hypothetical protein [Caudoviricetes sp.]